MHREQEAMSCCHLSWSKGSTLARLLERITEFSPRQNYGIWLYLNTSVLLWSLLLLAELFMTEDTNHTRLRMQGTEAYLVYSFGAMLIWVLGAGLHLSDHVYVHQIVARWSSSSSQKQAKDGKEEKYRSPEDRRLLDYSCKRYNADDEDSENATTNHEERSASDNVKQSKRLIDLCTVLFEFILSVNFLDYSRRAFSSWNTPDNDVADEFIDILINIAAFSYQVVRLWKIRNEDIARELAEIRIEKEERDTDDDSNDTTVFEEVP